MDEKKRSRKKQLYHDIVKQVEFYFSPANLSKDRFMTHALAENENGIEINVLMTFNKLKSLTTDVNILIKALRLSECLELTDNETRIKSKQVFHPKQNEDDCTIYVERLPLDANVDFMRQVFSPFGKIDYVSLPKFHNGKLKGFGFIEFADPSGANKAVEEFRKTGSYLPIDMAPGNLRSICTFDKKTKDKLLSSRTKNFDYDESANSRDDEDMNMVAEEIENVELNVEAVKNLTDVNFDSDDNEKKRKHKTSPSTLERKKKKVKPEEKDEENANITEISSSDKSAENLADKSTENLTDKSADNLVDKSSENVTDKSMDDSVEKSTDNDTLDGDVKKEIQTEEDTEMSDHDNQDDIGRQVKKKRRQKKKVKRDRPTANSGLLILSKADWKKLRNKYLNVQWEKMKLLKKHLSKCKQQPEPFSSGNQFSNGNGLMSFVEVPNSVVKILMEQPVVDLKAFKAEVRSKNSDVINIDVKEGATEVHVRFNSAEAAGNFASADCSWKSQIISGDEERKYWLKIHQERENKKEKRNKKVESMDNEHVDSAAMEEETPSSKALKDKPVLSIKPGTIVKILTTQPIINIKQFKTDLKMTCKDVLYVDVKEGSCEAFVRLDTAENAQLFASDISHGNVQFLTDEEEKSYRDKINEDRKNKFNKNIRMNKRGKQKIIKRAEKIMGKHILFEDSGDMII